MLVCPQISQIGVIGIFLAGFDWNIVSFTDIRQFQELFSHGIRAGDAARFQLGVKLTHYSGYYKAGVVADIHSDCTLWLMDKEAE
jgi:hypothetical protein